MSVHRKSESVSKAREAVMGATSRWYCFFYFYVSHSNVR